MIMSSLGLAAQTAVPTPAEVTRPRSESATGDQTVELNAFEVKADSDTSYGALNSNSVTRFNVELSKLPISADVYNEAFMKDVNASSVEQMIAGFTAGAGFASSDGPASTVNSQPGDRANNSYIQLRGLTAPGMQRDGFMTLATFSNTGSTANGVTNNFDIERAEVIMGPQALLYGNGGGGGVVNLVSKQARFNKPSFGQIKGQVDQYGSKEGQFDFGWGNRWLAVRGAFIAQRAEGRRVNLFNDLNGQYLQIAAKPFSNTTVRLTGQQTSNLRNFSSNLTLTAASAANDARNGQFLHYLIATNQLNAAANGGASGAGAVGNGAVNWDNADSYFGWWLSENTIDSMATLDIETKWTRTLSTQISIGYKDYVSDRVQPSTSALLAPNASANTLGVWAVGGTGGGPTQDGLFATKTFPVRFSIFSENDLFKGRAHSQSIIGADYTRLEEAYIGYGYFQADANFNVVVNPALTTNNGRIPMGNVLWPMNSGPMAYPYWKPLSDRVTFNGVNYVRQLQNPSLASAVTAENPLGVTLGGGNYNLVRVVSKGLYGVNNTTWMDGKLTTLLGFRASDSTSETLNQGSAITALSPRSGARKTSDEKDVSFSVGANYALRPWLRPYFSVSDSHNPPIAQNNDPIGNQPVAAHAIGEEVGVKVQNASNSLSGSLAVYHTSSKNETYFVTSTLAFDINPSGLNGRYGGSPSTIINVDRESSGAQLAVTASPTRNWRLRFSAAYITGKINTSKTYNALYNDQFYANSSGQVTYRDGAVVYVNPTYTAASPTVAEGTAGAIPLTVAMMSTSGNSYYANPLAISGQINSSSNAARVLLNPTASLAALHGPILTGATGLPISQIQINPGFVPPSAIPVTKAGESTTNYPGISTVLTSMYTFSEGWLRGVRAGGTLSLGWKNRRYYYYTNGVTVDGGRALFNFPTQARYDLILGYSKRLRRFDLGTQINVYNLFNTYHVIITPNAVNGYAGPSNATFDAQPRLWTWSTTIGF
jgi:outer membrane receptor protein involved in Fe transport